MIFTMLNGHGKKRENPFHKWLLKKCDRNHMWPTKPTIFTICLYRKGLTNLGTESANHELKSGGERNEG